MRNDWNGRYILVGHEAVPEPDLFVWAQWFETADRHVAFDTVGAYRVSTVFLGLDYGFGDGPPLLFETMVFHIAGGGEDLETARYTTWDEAVAGHAEIVAGLRIASSN